mmetsp:Transcript_3293/g.8287  ORF Transcript_3293/g.8287 Transcript_3293/m.8287 type:complete len:239 (-) Transcript_3293:191-907(-)
MSRRSSRPKPLRGPLDCARSSRSTTPRTRPSMTVTNLTVPLGRILTLLATCLFSRSVETEKSTSSPGRTLWFLSAISLEWKKRRSSLSQHLMKPKLSLRRSITPCSRGSSFLGAALTSLMLVAFFCLLVRTMKMSIRTSSPSVGLYRPPSSGRLAQSSGPKDTAPGRGSAPSLAWSGDTCTLPVRFSLRLRSNMLLLSRASLPTTPATSAATNTSVSIVPFGSTSTLTAMGLSPPGLL